MNKLLSQLRAAAAIRGGSVPFSLARTLATSTMGREHASQALVRLTIDGHIALRDADGAVASIMQANTTPLYVYPTSCSTP